jgi:hypothetical protein
LTPSEGEWVCPREEQAAFQRRLRSGTGFGPSAKQPTGMVWRNAAQGSSLPVQPALPGGSLKGATPVARVEPSRGVVGVPDGHGVLSNASEFSGRAAACPPTPPRTRLLCSDRERLIRRRSAEHGAGPSPRANPSLTFRPESRYSLEADSGFHGRVHNGWPWHSVT